VTFMYLVYVGLLAALLVGGVAEQRRHLRNLHSIPVRVLVNGSRGKSSVTRLVAGALRGGGLVTVGKTTGTAARFIFPDGNEVPVARRFNIANVSEQIRITAMARSEGAEALVMECMAVDPALQELNQKRLVQSTIGVITNVREDHMDEMGPTLRDVARSLSRSMPRGGLCITSEHELVDVLASEAARRKCRLVHVDAEAVSDAEMAGFRHMTFKENVSIALAVAANVGIPRHEALRGMWSAAPDPGVLETRAYHVAGKELTVANVFAANDPRSTLMNYRRLIELGQIQPPIFTVINCRPDRIERNGQMGEIVDQLNTDALFVIGAPTKSALDAVPQVFNGTVVDLGGKRPPSEILAEIAERAVVRATVLCVGNIHGQGELLLEEFERIGSLPRGSDDLP
jgi:gamma-polyglutamate synthase